MRHRVRAIQLKHWKRGKTTYKALLAKGAKPEAARQIAVNSRRWWRNSGMLLKFGPNPQVDGCPPYPPPRLTSTLRTARCGPACRVVWQGRGHNDRPLCRSQLNAAFTPPCYASVPIDRYRRRRLQRRRG
ncbi:hypothetical protein BN406_04411 (plasmid) [Sinorhizobium meliloti Rm41]|nr:hypothetical protein BN406_04411 [Sinorhizobium meliloti Rm41]